MKASRQIKTKFTLFAGDLFLLAFSLALGTYLRVEDPWGSFDYDRLATSFYLVVTLLCLFLTRAYEVQPQASATKYLQRPFLGMSAAIIAMAVLFYLAQSIRFARGIFAWAYLIAFSTIMIWRLTCFLLLRRRSLAVLIIGDPAHVRIARQVIREFSPRARVRVWEAERAGSATLAEELPNGGSSTEPDPDLAILAGHTRDPVMIRKAASLRLSGVEVWDLLRVSAEFTERLPAGLLDEHWLATAEGFRSLSDKSFRAGKRLLDIILAAGGLLLTSPLLAVAALTIKLQDGGSIIYSQVRLGRGERPFRVHKLRTMIGGAEEVSGPVWASPEDPRVTRTGRWLRRLRLDEIPQMWNVLKGEMSCVGPRPERPCFTTELKAKYPFYAYRHLVRPGITGWAQIRCPYAASEEATLRKLEYDLYYVQNASFLFDLRIILKTITIAASAWGSR